LVLPIENNNKNLSEELSRKLRKKGDNLREELTSKLAGEVKKLCGDMGKLRADTDDEILSVNNIDKTCEKLEGQLNGHIGETEKCLDRINEEMRTSTKVLEIGLKQQTEDTDEIKSLRQELIQGQQQSKVDINSQLLAEQQARHATPWKVGRPWRKLGALSDIFRVVQVALRIVHYVVHYRSLQMAREQSTMLSTNHRLVLIDMNCA
jgi:hypothetical protein